MSEDREETIRRRAYELWEQGGGDHGRDQDHWHQASGEVDAGHEAPAAGTMAPDGTTIGDTADGDGGNGASIPEAEVTEPVAPKAKSTTAKTPPRPRKSKTTK